MTNELEPAHPARARVLRAATRLFAAAPATDAVTIDRITAEAGISRGTFYRYFGSKNALLAELSKAGLGMTRVQSIDRREEIMNVALRLVAEHGLHATTMEQVASAAGITKGAIYWYFKDKQELFQSSFRRLSPLLNMLPTLEMQIDSPPEEMLTLVARTFLSTFDNPDAVRFFRVLLSEAPRIPEVANNYGQNARPALDFLIRYFKHQIRAGRLIPHDAQSSARFFTGALIIYIMSRELFPRLHEGLPDQQRYCKELVATFLNGISTRQDKPSHNIIDGTQQEGT